jgi:hypothetical protein
MAYRTCARAAPRLGRRLWIRQRQNEERKVIRSVLKFRYLGVTDGPVYGIFQFVFNLGARLGAT